MNTKNPILLAVVGAVIASFVFYNYALKPKRKEATAAEAKVTEAQAKLDAAQLLLTTNQDARGSFRAAYSTVVRLGKAVPADDDVRSLIVQLDQAAKKTRVSFQSIQVGNDAAGGGTTASGAQLPPGATIGPAGFPVMPFTFSFRGGFFRLSKFFHRIDTLVKANNDRIAVTGRLLTVDGIKLEAAPTGFPDITASVEATAYLVNPIEGPTGGATAAGPTGSAGATAAPAAGGPATTTATSTGAIR